MENRARNDLFIEGPQVFEAASAPSEQNQINFLCRLWSARLFVPAASECPFVQEIDSAGNLHGCALALNAARGEHDFEARISALYHMQHIANSGPGRRSYQANPTRKSWQRPFAFGSEEA